MRTLAVLGMAGLLLALFFQGCPSSTEGLPPVQVPTEEAATPPSESPPEETEAPPPPAEPSPTSPPPSPTSAPEPTVPMYSEPVVLAEVQGEGDTVTDNFEWPACQKAVFYWTVSPNSYGTASLIVYLHRIGVERGVVLVNEMAMSVSVEGLSGSALQPLSGGEYYFSTENTDEPWTIRVECQDHVAPVGAGIDLQPVGNIVTDNYELPACQKSVFVWSAGRNDIGTASLILWLCGEECTVLVNEFQMDLIAPMEGEALQALRGGIYYLVSENSSGPWSVRWECRD
jgi:hypothetical protein